MKNIVESSLFIGLSTASLIVGCAKAPSSPTVNKTLSDSSLRAVMAPPAPVNQLSGKGFGLEDPVPAGGATTTTAKIPTDAIAAEGGGYWYTPTADATKVVGGTGVMQYYDKSGVPQQWFGGYGAPKSGVYQSDPKNTSTFTMMKGTGSSLDASQQFVVEKSGTSWSNATGQILGANGQPYTYQGANGQQIVSQGFNYGANGMNYNWNALNPQSPDSAQKSFTTNGYDLNGGFSSGMTYYTNSGAAVPYQPNPQMPGAIGFLSRLFQGQ